MLVNEIDGSSILSRQRQRRRGIGRSRTSPPMFCRIVSYGTCKGRLPRNQDSNGGEDIRVEVRMANDNQFQPTQLLDLLDCVFIEIRNEVPQDVAMCRLDEARRLANCNLFFDQFQFPTLMQHRGDTQEVDTPWAQSIPPKRSHPSHFAQRRSCGLHREGFSML